MATNFFLDFEPLDKQFILKEVQISIFVSSETHVYGEVWLDHGFDTRPW